MNDELRDLEDEYAVELGAAEAARHDGDEASAQIFDATAEEVAERINAWHVAHTICGAPCPHGGVESARRRSTSDLGWMGHCNRRTGGGTCWQHRQAEQ